MQPPGPGARRTVSTTVVFTDLVGSTELSARRSAAAADELRRTHFDLLRSAIDNHRGTEVKNLGDGIMAVFASVGDALEASVAIQRRAHRHNAATDDDPMLIRIGVAAGDCTLDDGDYFGETVVQAARLCNLAEGGSILVTAAVPLLAPRGHHDFESLGRIELKGLPEPVEVALVTWSPPDDVAAHAARLPDRLAVARPVPFVGRSEQLELGVEAFKTAAEGERRVLLVSGEAGQGKTRLATELALHAAESGALVLYGRCDDQLTQPYGPWRQAIENWERGREPGDDGASARDLRSLLDVAGPRPSSRDTDHHVLYSAFEQLLLEQTELNPVVLVLDDLHWADRDSLLLLRHVVSRVISSRLLVAGTYRGTDLDERHPMRDLLAALRREPGVDRIELEGLSSEDIAKMIGLTASSPVDEDLVQLITDESGGNPFFVGELLWHIDAVGADRIALGGPRGLGDTSDTLLLPDSVREVVLDRIGRLGEPASRALTLASVIGREFDLDLLAAVAELDESELLDVVDAVVGAGVLNQVGPDGDRLAFPHALVRRTLAGTLSPRRRSLVHRQVAMALEDPAYPGRSSAVELAFHWNAAKVRGGEQRLRRLAAAAGAEARGRRAPEEAIMWYRRAIELTDAQAPDSCELLVQLGDAERQAGHPAHRAHLIEAAHRAVALERPDLLVAAALANHRGFQSGAGTVDEERIEVLRMALDAVADGNPPDRALLLAMLAVELTFTGDTDRTALALEAVGVARTCGDTDVLLDVIALALTVLVAPQFFERAAALSAEAMELTSGSRDPVRRMQALFGEQAIRMIKGDTDGVMACTTEYEELVDRLGQPVRQWTAALRSAVLHTLIGDHDTAEERIEATLELGQQTGQPDAFVSYAALLMGLRIHQGRTDELIDLVDQFAEQNPGLPVLRAAQASFLAEAGRIDEAARTIEALGDLQLTLPQDHFWLATLALLSEAATSIAHRDAASAILPMIEPYHDRIATHPAGCLGAVSFVLGDLRSAMGLDEAAHRSHLDGLERHERLRSPYFVARSHLALSRWDPDHLGTAAAISRRHGFDGIERRVAGLQDHGRAPSTPETA